jgi:predicted amidohydrolase YtcJ
MKGSKIIICWLLIMNQPLAFSAEPPDLILKNARVFTLDEKRPRAEAVAVAGGKILAVGKDAEVLALSGKKTRIIDCRGNFLLPAFADAHGHFLSLGRTRMQLDLAPASSFEDIAALVEKACREKEPGRWIIGRGWHQEKWQSLPSQMVDGLPRSEALDRVCPRHPVLLVHASGHAALANSKALAAAGISGKSHLRGVVVDGNGRPTGALREEAAELAWAAYENWRDSLPPQEQEKELYQAVENSASVCLRRGVTFFQDAGSTFEEIDFFLKMAREGRLPLRLWVMIGEDNRRLEEKIAKYRIIRAGGGRLTVRAIKRYADGALGSHGAWLKEPYADFPEKSGEPLIEATELEKTARLAAEHGFQLCTHAIGDRANSLVLEVYEKALGAAGDPKKFRWRIEHAQILDPADIKRFAALGVIASMQAFHCVSDGPWMEKRLGAKRSSERAYLWRSLWQAGALIANGTDTPVEAEDPLAGFYAFITRKLPDGKSFSPQQTLSREQALYAMIMNPARAAFEEDVLGSIEPGKYADLVLLSNDLLSVPEEEILNTRVLLTLLGGEVVHHEL